MPGKVTCVLVVLAMAVVVLAAASAFAEEPIHRRYMSASTVEERGRLMKQFTKELEAVFGKAEMRFCRNEMLFTPEEVGGGREDCEKIMGTLRRNLTFAKERADGYTHISTAEFSKAKRFDERGRKYGKTYTSKVPRIPWSTTTTLTPRLTFTYLHDGFIYGNRCWRNGRSTTSAFREGFTLRVNLSRGGGGRNCFVAGTLVLMADNTFKPIEDVKVGDRVLSRDERTGKDMTAEVYKLLRGKETAIYKFDDGLQVNADHRFYTDKGPVMAGNLKPGTVLRGVEGTRTLCSIDRQGPTLASTEKDAAPSIPVYNIMVRGTHTFFVSPDGNNTYMVLDISACGQ